MLPCPARLRLVLAFSWGDVNRCLFNATKSTNDRPEKQSLLSGPVSL